MAHLRDARVEAFDQAIAAFNETVRSMNPQAFDPGIQQDIPDILGQSNDAFLPTITNDGKIKIPQDKIDTNDIAIVPLLDPDEVLYTTHSSNIPTYHSAGRTALRHHIDPPFLHALARKQAVDGVASYHLDNAYAVTNVWSPEVIVPREGEPGIAVPVQSRPVIMLSPGLYKRANRSQIGVVLGHELTHAFDLDHTVDLANADDNRGAGIAHMRIQNSNDREEFTPEERKRAHLELRAYYVEAQLLRGQPANVQAHHMAQQALGAERTRRRLALPGQPFTPTVGLMQRLITDRVIRTQRLS